MSLRWSKVVLLGAVLVACSSNDDKPSKSTPTGASGESGDDNAAGETSVAGKNGSSGSSNNGGSANQAGGSSGGNGTSGNSTSGNGTAGDTGRGDGGEPPATGGGEPPELEGDGIAWTWNGKSYLVNKKMYAGFFGQVERVNIKGQDTDEDVPPNQFDLHLMPNKLGTYQCSDYITGTDSSFSISWLTMDKTASPPNPGFTFAKELPCEFTVTRADKGDTVGDVFEGTFKAGLRFPGIPGVWEQQDRLDIVGRMRWTKK